MRLTTSSMEFSRAVNTVSRAVAKTTNSVMDCIYMMAADDTLFLKGSDNDLSIVTSIPAGIRAEGEIVVPVKTLMELVRTYPSDAEISIEVNDRDKVTFICAASEISLQTRDPDEYPRISAVALSTFFTVPNAAFRNMVRQTIFACSQNEAIAPILKGMFVECEDGYLRFVAMDGYIMAVRSEKIPDNPYIQCVVPSRTMNELLRILTLYESDAIVNISQGKFVVNVGTTQIISNLLSGNYLNYKALAPTDITAVVKFNVKDVISAAERAHLLREQLTICTMLAFQGDSLKIFAQSAEGKVYEEMEISKSGDDVSVALDSQFLIDVLRSIPEERAIVELKDERNPVVFRPVDSDKYMYLIMPSEIPKLYADEFLQEEEYSEG